MRHPQTAHVNELWQVGVLVTTTAAIRAVVAAGLPERLLSPDFRIWQTVTDVLLRGGNPYATTSLLFYPPLWMQVLFVLGKVSIHTHVPLIHLIQAVLIGVDVATVVVVYLFMRALGVGQRAFWIALVGVALNPVSILLTCQHGNFDGLVGLLALAAVFALAIWNRGGAESAWLLACLMLGLGILAKTVPLILSPLLLTRWRDTDWPGRVVGAALVFGPAFLGVSVLYALSPQRTAANIFQYRSAAGYFGVSGLLNIVGGTAATGRYSSVYPLLALSVLIGTSLFVIKRKPVTNVDVLLLSALLLLWIPPLGSGYGPQYAGWFIGILVVLYAVATGLLRWSLLIFGLVALATYVAEFVIMPTPLPEQTVLRLPLFLAYLGVLAAGVVTLLPDRDRRSLSVVR